MIKRIQLRTLIRRLNTDFFASYTRIGNDFFAESKKFLSENSFAVGVFLMVAGFMASHYCKLDRISRGIREMKMDLQDMKTEMKIDLRDLKTEMDAMKTEILDAVREQGSAATKLAIDSEVRRQVDLQQTEMRKLLVKNEVREQWEQKEKEKNS